MTTNTNESNEVYSKIQESVSQWSEDVKDLLWSSYKQAGCPNGDSQEEIVSWLTRLAKEAGKQYENNRHEQIRKETIEAFANPQIGDRFHEMYSYWLFVVQVEPEIITLEAGGPCKFPDDAKLRRYASAKEFQARFACGADYEALLADRNNDVSGWLEYMADEWQKWQ